VTGIRSPAEAKNFSSSLCVQTGSQANPALHSTGGGVPGGHERPGREADHSPPSSAEVKNGWQLYLLSYLATTLRKGTALLFTFYALNENLSKRHSIISYSHYFEQLSSVSYRMEVVLS
jgi:hypothetical protein